MYDLEYILTKTGVGELSGMGSEWILNEATGVACVADTARRGSSAGASTRKAANEAWLVTGFPYDELEFTHEE